MKWSEWDHDCSQTGSMWSPRLGKAGLSPSATCPLPHPHAEQGASGLVQKLHKTATSYAMWVWEMGILQCGLFQIPMAYMNTLLLYTIRWSTVREEISNSFQVQFQNNIYEHLS